MRRAVFLVSLASGLTAPVAAQQPPVKTITTGVVVDVTVVDGKGNPVLDLTPADFELSEDGVRQRIVSATLVHGAMPRPLNSRAALDGQPAAQAAESPSVAGSTPAITPSVTAILFDRLSAEARALARHAALAYVSTLTPPYHYAGVFLADLSLRTFQPFTNQREPLARGRSRGRDRAREYTGCCRA